MKRAISLDVFRGYAIVTMVLSGTIASGVLPGWMYHAQMGPRCMELHGLIWSFRFFCLPWELLFLFPLGER